MKLLYCEKCHDVFNLTGRVKACFCGETGGRYLDNLNAEYWGPCKPLGFANKSFVEALLNQPLFDEGKRFTAFVIPHQCPTMEKITNTGSKESVIQKETTCLE